MPVNDYFDLLEELKSRLTSRSNIDTVLKIYTVIGLVTTVLAIGYFTLTILPFDLTYSQQMALTVAGVGLALAALSFILIFLRKEKEASRIERLLEYDALSNFLSAWSKFESASKDALRMEGSELKTHSLREILSHLFEKRIIDEGDIIVLEEALRIRNALVHGRRAISSAVAKNATGFLLNLISKMTKTKFQS